MHVLYMCYKCTRTCVSTMPIGDKEKDFTVQRPNAPKLYNCTPSESGADSLCEKKTEDEGKQNSAGTAEESAGMQPPSSSASGCVILVRAALRLSGFL